MEVLVVGANGQLGAACCRTLLAQEHRVRGSVRSLDRAVGLDGIDVRVADLAGDLDLDSLLSGVEAVIITANTAAPRAGDDAARFIQGEHRLIDSAGRLGVQRIVLPSVPATISMRTCPSRPSGDVWRRRSAPRSRARSSCASHRSWRFGWRSSGRRSRCEASGTPPSGVRHRSCAGTGRSPARQSRSTG